MSPAEPRLLFVVSGDYGELSNALYFLRGGAFAARLLLPDRLHAVNGDHLPVPAQRYASRADILAAAARERPDVVFLFSGYLLAFNGVLSLDAVRELVPTLGERGARLAVTDPFLGLLRAGRASPFSERHPAKAQLEAHFAEVARAMRDATHLYLVAPDADAPRTLAFFNPAIVVDAPFRAQPAQWLFVLAAEDAAAQMHRLGQERFTQLLRARLADAASAGCQPVLIAPPPVVGALAGTVQGLVAQSFCAHDAFTELLLAAQYAFYWNPFSNSVPARLVNNRAAFFFDRGHMAHAAPPLYELGLRTYYPGTQPAMLALDAPLDADRLAALAAEQPAALEPAQRRFRSALAPREVVRRILAEANQ